MENNQTILMGFVERLYAASDIDSLFNALEWAVKQLGFDHVSYTYVPDLLNRLLGDLSPVFKLSEAYPVDFIDQYAACNFGQHDFTIKKISQGEQARRGAAQRQHERHHPCAANSYPQERVLVDDRHTRYPAGARDSSMGVTDA